MRLPGGYGENKLNKFHKALLIIGIILLLEAGGLGITHQKAIADTALGWMETEECPWLGFDDYWHYSESTAEVLYNALHTVPLVPDSKHYVKIDTYIDLAFQWSSVDDDHSWLVLTRSLNGFDTSAINSSDEINGGRVKVKVKSLSTYAGAQYAVAWYAYTGEDTAPPYAFSDWDELTFNLDPGDALTEPKAYEEINAAKVSGDYLEFELTQAGIDYINRGGNTQMWLRFCFDGAGASGIPKYRGGLCIYNFYHSGSGLVPILEVDYLRGVITRDICDHSNAAEGGSGDDITGISWLTPRCAFNDEQAGFRVEGEAGCPFTAQMVGANDTVLDEVTDTIRTNDYYLWYPSLGGYTGKFRCEVVGELNGTWGWSEEYTNAGSMRTFAMQLENEQTSWSTDIQDYEVSDAEIVMAWYWLSGIEEGELSTTTLTIRQGGPRSNDIYSEYLDDLVINYMECDDSCNYFLVASRYILASMGELEDDLDDLIINLNSPLVALNKGYYYARIYKAGEGLLIPVSAYWYVDICDLVSCPPVCDLAIYVVEGEWAVGESIPIMVLNDEDLDFYNRFRDISLSIVGSSEDPVTGIINSEQYTITIVRPADAITAYLEISTTFDDYVHHSYLTLPEEGGGTPVIPPLPGLPDWGDWWDWLVDFFSTTWGHWLLLIILMAIACLIFYRKHHTVALILCLAFIGFGIVIGWIDAWLVILLAITGGLIIWRMVVSHRG